MRVLALSDVHESERVLEYFRANNEKYDCVIICGDSSNHSVSFMEDLLGLFPDAYIIPGNNEYGNVLDALKKAKRYAHGQSFGLPNRLRLCGFGFSNSTPFGTPGELGEEEIERGLSALEIDQNTILMLHSPPFGHMDEIKGKNVGSLAARKIIDEKKPLIVLCGHIHEIQGVKKVRGTLIVKVPCAEYGKYCVLDIDEKNGEISIYFKEMK